MSETSIASVVDSEAGELLPPQDIAAEQSVLGGMMLSTDAIADVVKASVGLSPVLLIGAALADRGRLYNCGLAIADGKLRVMDADGRFEAA